MGEINATEKMADELKKALNNKQVGRVMELNSIIKSSGLADAVERQLDDANYGLYRFIVTEAKKNNIGIEDEKENKDKDRDKEKEKKNKEDENKEDKNREERQ